MQETQKVWTPEPIESGVPPRSSYAGLLLYLEKTSKSYPFFFSFWSWKAPVKERVV